MEQFDECGGLIHGGEMVRLGDDLARKSVLESQLTAPSDVSLAKSYFGQFEAAAKPAGAVPEASFENTLPSMDITSYAPGLDGGSALGAGLSGGDLLNAGATPGGLLSGMFEILTEVMTAAPLDPNQAINLGQS